MTSRNKRWLSLISVNFFAQGIAPFGMKILADRHLTDRYVFHYLLIMFMGGLLFAPVSIRARPFFLLPKMHEILIGIGMALCNVAGMAFTALAFAKPVPAYLVVSLTQGGAVFLVMLAGIVLYKEKVGRYGLQAMALGLIAIVILSVS